MFLCFFVLILFVISGCVSTPQSGKKCERAVLVFGTVAKLHAEGKEAEAAVAECIKRLDELNRLLGADDPVAPLVQLHAAAGNGAWVALPPELWHILSVSQKYSELTNGAWDVTIAPLSHLWKRALADGLPPSNKEIEDMRKVIGWQKLELRENDKSARLTETGMALDLGGLRKGFALDECLRIYRKYQATGLIDLGESSLAAVGGKSRADPFRIALRHPRETVPARLGVLRLKDAALSSSGDYEHFFLYDGVRYHHILDPRTGRPVQNGVVSVFLHIAADEPNAGLVSDILSTAFFVTGAERSLALLPTLPVHVEAAFANETKIFAQTSGFTSSLMQ